MSGLKKSILSYQILNIIRFFICSPLGAYLKCKATLGRFLEKRMQNSKKYSYGAVFGPKNNVHDNLISRFYLLVIGLVRLFIGFIN